jgi:asparagine synthase (glutamine-hydrolysing)
MASALGTDHTSHLCTQAEIGRVFPSVIRHTERPVLRTAPAPLFVLSRIVNENGFKVVLTGEGADEVLGGYDVFKEAKIRRFCAQQPGSRTRPLLLRRLYPYLPNMRGQSQSYLAAFFGGSAPRLDDPLFSHAPRFRSTAAAKMVFSAETREALKGYDALDDLRSSLPGEFKRWHPLAQAQYLELTQLLPGYILSSQGDRVAMAHAVEGRFPFLDPRVVDLAARIPARLKLKGLREKHILRESVRGLLPPQILDRVKQPYRAPASEAFTGPGALPFVAECLSPQATMDGPFDPVVVAKLFAKAEGRPLLGYRDNTAFVGVLSTELWRRAFVVKHPARSRVLVPSG